MSTSTEQSELEAQEADLIQQIDKLDHGWPSDGWDGAAEAAVVHVGQIREKEAELALIHEKLGRHRPDLERYYPSGKCYCGFRFQ